EVTVRRRGPSRLVPILPSFQNLPSPAQVSFEKSWNVYTAGVGGMGAGVISAILVQAGQREGYRVLFSDKKGLAIRNGGVFGHILFCKDGGTLSPLVPYGKADLILGIDLLEAARGLDPKGNLRIAHAERTRAVVNTAENPTILMLMGQAAPARRTCEEALRRQTLAGSFFGADFPSISEHY